MTDARALGAEHASLLCDRVAEHSRAQLAAFGKARGDFHEDIIDVLLLEEESSASLSAAVTERLASMDARLADLALEYADALRREMDAEVAEHERAVESIDRELAALRTKARESRDAGDETMDEKKKNVVAGRASAYDPRRLFFRGSLSTRRRGRRVRRRTGGHRGDLRDGDDGARVSASRCSRIDTGRSHLRRANF
jgi:hypothetical protein